jgi:hypothetical protein
MVVMQSILHGGYFMVSLWVPTTSFHIALSTIFVSEASNIFHHIEFFCCEVVFLGGPRQKC